MEFSVSREGVFVDVGRGDIEWLKAVFEVTDIVFILALFFSIISLLLNTEFSWMLIIHVFAILLSALLMVILFIIYPLISRFCDELFCRMLETEGIIFMPPIEYKIFIRK